MREMLRDLGSTFFLVPEFGDLSCVDLSTGPWFGTSTSRSGRV